MSQNAKRWEPEPEEDVPASLAAFLDDESLTDGQRRRLSLFRTVESGVCSRIEQICVSSGLEVQDVAVLVVDASAQGLFFQGDDTVNGTCVVLGHRERLYAFLTSVLPPAEDAPFDPYADLRDPAPPRCVRVLIIDHESLTVMSYGTFVTIRLDTSDMPQA